jgi:hypothetical protein
MTNGPSDPNLEHLKLIQAVIMRLAGNSFLLKGWSVTLVAGLAALTKTQGDRSFAWIALGVVAVFWFLDSYYLALERAYRDLYRDVVAGTAENWTLKATVPPDGIVKAAGSIAVVPLHGAVALGAIIVGLSA